MRFLVQRVARAAVTVEGKTVGEIGRGLLVFVGISKADIMGGEPYSHDIAGKMVKKLLGLRIFEDENGKTNLGLQSVGGSLLLISQFTLYADCRKGNRPSFTNAGEPGQANLLYQYIIQLCRQGVEGRTSMEEAPSRLYGKVEEGIFGADMEVELVNDGPFTVFLDSDEMMG